MSEEFFIGWQGKAPEKTGRFVKRIVLVGAVIAAATSAVVAGLQSTAAKEAVFNAEMVEFSGILVKEPVPMLVGDDNEVRLLTNPFKFGFDEEVAARFHLKHVTMEGMLITRDGKDLIQAEPTTMKLSAAEGTGAVPQLLEEGAVTLRGEIVDSKCYLGMMNPGHLKTHRACAINCIKGGVPPVLLLRNAKGEANYILLVGAEGQAINEEILPLVAEPVQVTGRLKSLGNFSIIYADEDGIELIE